MSAVLPGKMTIDGLEGRYLLPVLPLLGWMAPVYPPSIVRVVAPAWIATVVFPLLSMAVVPGVVVDRFYDGWGDMVQVLRILYH